MTDTERQINRRAFGHALAQQRLEGLTVTPETQADLQKVADGATSMSTVIANLYERYAHVEVFKL